MTTHPWYSVFVPRPTASVRVYCLPCAGGSATMFRPWADWLPPEFELRAIRMPGRDTRYALSAFSDFETAGEDLADALGPELREPYVLFGHSMGGLIGYRLVQAIERRGLTPPVLYVVAASLVQGLPVERLPDPAESDERFVEVLRQLGGVPPEVLADPEVLAFTLPALRADFGLCRTYTYRPDEPPVRVPLRVLGGVADTVTPLAHMALWRDHAESFLGLRRFPGGHFFLRDDVAGVVGALVDDITALAS